MLKSRNWNIKNNEEGTDDKYKNVRSRLKNLMTYEIELSSLEAFLW